MKKNHKSSLSIDLLKKLKPLILEHLQNSNWTYIDPYQFYWIIKYKKWFSKNKHIFDNKQDVVRDKKIKSILK